MPIVARRQSALPAAAVPVAATAANIASYALLLAAAHLMSAADYGKLSSLLGLLLIASIPMLALQTVTARRTAAGDGLLGMVRGASVVAAVSTLGLAGVSPAIAAFLHLRSVSGVLLVAATIPATAVLGTAMGVAQGRRDFRRLAMLIFLATAGRSVGGLVGLSVRHTTIATLTGVLAGTAVAAIGVTLVGGGLARHRTALLERARRGVVTETLKAAYAHGSFLLLTSLDVLLARHVLPATSAGVYAVGSVIARAALWLPQSVVTLMFASLAEREHHQATARRAAAVLGALGVVVVGGTALAGPLIVTVVGGQKYHRLDGAAWLFALLGALLALVQLAVLAGLAQRRVRRAALLWLTIVADLAIVLATSEHATPTRLVVTLVFVTTAMAAIAVLLTVTDRPDRTRMAGVLDVGDAAGTLARPPPVEGACVMPGFEDAWGAAAPVAGWMTQAQGRSLWDAAEQVPSGATILEIGSHQGRSTIVLATAAKHRGSTVIAVDPFVSGPMFGGAATRTRFEKHLSDAGLSDVVRLIAQPSTAIRPAWDEPLAMLYIDGKHDYWTVRDDLRWIEHLPVGASVLVHDSFSSIGVTLGLLVQVLPGRALRYLGRAGSMARFEVAAPSAADRWRMVRELPWFLCNVVIKIGLRAARLVGYHGTPDPY